MPCKENPSNQLAYEFLIKYLHQKALCDFPVKNVLSSNWFLQKQNRHNVLQKNWIQFYEIATIGEHFYLKLVLFC